MKMKMKIKIRLKTGRVVTLTIEEETENYISGKDKFGIFTKINKEDIDTSFGVK